MTDDTEARRRRLRETLSRHEAAEAAEQRKESGEKAAVAGYAAAFRLSTEFLSALAVGGAIGYGLDWALGTNPWLLIVFFLLGFGAGILNVLRSAGLIQTPEAGKRPPGGV